MKIPESYKTLKKPEGRRVSYTLNISGGRLKTISVFEEFDWRDFWKELYKSYGSPDILSKGLSDWFLIETGPWFVDTVEIQPCLGRPKKIDLRELLYRFKKDVRTSERTLRPSLRETLIRSRKPVVYRGWCSCWSKPGHLESSPRTLELISWTSPWDYLYFSFVCKVRSGEKSKWRN